MMILNLDSFPTYNMNECTVGNHSNDSNHLRVFTWRRVEEGKLHSGIDGPLRSRCIMQFSQLPT